MRKKDYEFKDKYFLKLGIGTKFEEIHSIDEDSYKELNKWLNNSDKAMIKTFKKNFICFENDGIKIEIENDGSEWAIFLENYQNKEIRKIKNEYSRHRNLDFEKKSLDIDKLEFQRLDEVLIEDFVTQKIYMDNIEKIMEDILTLKEFKRIKNYLSGKTISEIAKSEGTSVQCIYQSLNNSFKKLKKNKKFSKNYLKL